MKKIISAFLFLLSAELFAAEKTNSIEAGITGGISLFQYQINDILIDNEFASSKLDVKAGASWQFGITGGYYLMPDISLNLDLLYLNKSVQIDKEYAGSTFSSSAGFGFLNASLGSQYHFMEIFYAGGGLFIGMPVSKPKILDKTVDSANFKNEIGLYGDFGVRLPIDEMLDLFGGIRVHFAFTQIYDNPNLKSMTIGDGINDSSLEKLNTQLLTLIFGITYRIEL
ncbi:MAG TPA: hypothetical protein DHW82_05270 [Spirochaetia bacterium]|nr:MAG: hypothetical protein A2Y41_04560 [Spirochaetes bacterium GWB1_36_13]HCL56402.1 hypothetical protein [Spirochaetia bacterium]